ncbi:hypothetical protein NQ314_003924 [Rhamnusium bicolor]|uniref:Uncharacterized protein n=1 Tax=Rhamnusium bicolor TaxID=1586634 RepID=A0AAV8ZNI7_9CUCU|nr:hypothetical protein NQ314_003924 [Rhamnusium bicolor]
MLIFLRSLYLAKLGNQTRSFQNPLGNVPSVVFSDEYKKEESDLAEKDFIKALCAKIQGEKPAECYKNGTDMFSINAGLLLITMFTCYFY